MQKELPIRPYARLITMLGDQLIKNETIALVELIKNSYDADANWVKVSFLDFNEDFSITSKSKIVIEDDGCGMNADIIEKHWLNPATPEKLKRKAQKKSTTEKGRILQGEKGIGRFAIFKLGSTIKITTRSKIDDETGDSIESVLIYDFSKYDNEFLSENGVEKDLFLDDLKVRYSQQNPIMINKEMVQLGTTLVLRKPFGTRIEIGNLKNDWSDERIKKIQSEIGKMQPIFSFKEEEQVSLKELTDFSVWTYKDDEVHESQERYKEKLANCIDCKSVFKITEGFYNEDRQVITFNLNSRKTELNFKNQDILGLKQFKEYFKNSDYRTECGNFKFEFYIFDLMASGDSKYVLDSDEKKSIKEHRIYLYRDGIRVLPYGDPEDDWLKIDMFRGTISIGEFLSNDQVVGCIFISQKENPKLKDKTNREGLIEEGRALNDFVNVIQLVLRYIRKDPYSKYLIDKKRKKEINDFKQGKPLELIENAKKQLGGDVQAHRFISNFEKSYRQEQRVLYDRIAKTENLAAVGLSVETASHDVMLFLKKSLEQVDSIIKDLSMGQELDKDVLSDKMTLLRGNLSMVETQMRDIRLLFPSTKTKTKNININDIIEKVYRLYKRPFLENAITLNINSIKPELIVKTTDAVLLQVFINLFDNALYWLKTVDAKKEIIITVDGTQRRVIFSDNGPGIKTTDVNYIFEAFYSGKGEDGRGLGLYIAKQLLDRYDYTIDLAEFSKDKVLEGANFVLEFIKEE